MSKVKLNKKSVKRQGGAMIPSQPAMSNQQQQVDPMVKQVTELISTSVNQGKEIVDVIIELSQQQVDQQVIAQALMMGGMQQECNTGRRSSCTKPESRPLSSKG